MYYFLKDIIFNTAIIILIWCLVAPSYSQEQNIVKYNDLLDIENYIYPSPNDQNEEYMLFYEKYIENLILEFHFLSKNFLKILKVSVIIPLKQLIHCSEIFRHTDYVT